MCWKVATQIFRTIISRFLLKATTFLSSMHPFIVTLLMIILITTLKIPHNLFHRFDLNPTHLEKKKTLCQNQIKDTLNDTGFWRKLHFYLTSNHREVTKNIHKFWIHRNKMEWSAVWHGFSNWLICNNYLSLKILYYL